MLNDLHQYPAIAVIISESEEPRVRAIPEGELKDIHLDGEEFTDSGVGDWLGFYDWLRKGDGRIVGVRIWLDTPLELLTSIKRCLGVRLLHDDFELRVVFAQDNDFDDASSCDHDFGGNQLLVGKNSYAFTFNSPVQLSLPVLAA